MSYHIKNMYKLSASALKLSSLCLKTIGAIIFVLVDSAYAQSNNGDDGKARFQYIQDLTTKCESSPNKEMLIKQYGSCDVYANQVVSGTPGTALNQCKDDQKLYKTDRDKLEKSHKDEIERIEDKINDTEEAIRETKTELTKAENEMQAALQEAEAKKEKDEAEFKKAQSERVKELRGRYDELSSKITEFVLAIQKAHDEKRKSIEAAKLVCHNQALQYLEQKNRERQALIQAGRLSRDSLKSLFSITGPSSKEKKSKIARDFYDSCVRDENHKEQIRLIDTAHLRVLEEIQTQIDSARGEQLKIIQEINGEESQREFQEQLTAIYKEYERAVQLAQSTFQSTAQAKSETIVALQAAQKRYEVKLKSEDKAFVANIKEAADTLLNDSCAAECAATPDKGTCGVAKNDLSTKIPKRDSRSPARTGSSI